MKDFEEGIIKDRRDYMLEYIVDRIKRRKHMIICVVGPPGTGKTYFAISKAQQLSKMLGVPFSADNIVFDAQQFTDKITDAEFLKPKVNLIFEEIGVSMSSRTWQQKVQVYMNFYLQTCRSRNNILWFTTPSFSFMDSQARILTNLIIEMTSINEKEKTSRAKPLLVQYNQRSKKIYNKYLIFNHPEHGSCKFTEMIATLPPKDLLSAYELKKEEFNKKLAENLKAALKKQQKKEQKEQGVTDDNNPKTMLTPTEQNVYRLWVQGKTREESAEALGCGIANIKSMRHRINIKGWSCNP